MNQARQLIWMLMLIGSGCGVQWVQPTVANAGLPQMIEKPALPQAVMNSTSYPSSEEIEYISNVLKPSPQSSDAQKVVNPSEVSPYQLIKSPIQVRSQGQAIPTVYFTPRFTKADNTCEGLKVAIQNSKGQTLIKVCRHIYESCALQGACSIEGRLFNVTTGNVRLTYFAEITNMGCPYGKGVNMACLDPFHTIAADLRAHKPGDVIYVPKVRGTLLPDGKTHDGYFVVRDRGGAIKGRGRFDFFAGFMSYRDPNNPFAALGLGDKRNRFEYVEIKGEMAQKVLAARNFPRLPAQ